MNKRDFKDAVYGELASFIKALANPHRLEIIELLAQRGFSVEEIATQIHVSVANASQHLQVLKKAQLVMVTRQGNFIHYRLANSNVFKVWKAIRELGGDRNITIDTLVKNYRESKFDIEFASVSIKKMLEKIESGKVIILDVRQTSEFNHGHIAGAICIPVDQLTKRLKELRKKKEIIVYCRGPFCVYADEAVNILVKAGYKASRLDAGFPDWQVQDLPVEVSLN